MSKDSSACRDVIACDLEDDFAGLVAADLERAATDGALLFRLRFLALLEVLVCPPLSLHFRFFSFLFLGDVFVKSLPVTINFH